MLAAVGLLASGRLAAAAIPLATSLADPPVVSRAIATPARAAHTATPSHHRAHLRHHRHVHAHRTVAALSRKIEHASAPVTPANPARRERPAPHPRAALPPNLGLLRHASGFKAGHRQAMAAPALGVPIGVVLLALPPVDRECVNQPESVLRAGRGPPRAGPVWSFHVPPCAWPFALSSSPRRSPPSSPTPSPSPHRSRFNRGGSAVPVPHRAEGAAACLSLPSAGGFS
jgi:hypothetical protein